MEIGKDSNGGVDKRDCVLVCLLIVWYVKS